MEIDMALLHYWNMGVHRPDVLMQRAFYGLRPFYEFLSATKNYMETDAAVLRLAWAPGSAPERERKKTARATKENRHKPVVDSGFWVALEEPKDRRNEPESTFRDFMDENVREVFELACDEDGQPLRMGRGGVLAFARERQIRVLDRDPETSQLQLERLPEVGFQLLLRPNTLTLKRQIDALQALQDQPASAQRPLLRLLEASSHARWPDFEPRYIADADWKVLTDVARPGTGEQREFVAIAMETPDFALLEGPPGSGKTTAICELILQLAGDGKRVLLCASTHVAVDNVLERLMDERNAHRDLVIPVRVGDRSNVSEKASGWQLERFIKTERDRLLRALQGQRSRTGSQQELLDAIQHGNTAIERMVLDSANLVCGTTIGILQHPDIKGSSRTSPLFDVLILDEASKTTFQEFLVPAMLARRWVVVGDPKQLSPYVDDTAMTVNVQACMPEAVARNACVDVFVAGHPSAKKRRVMAVALDTETASERYRVQAQARGVALADAGSSGELWRAEIVIGTHEQLEHRSVELPLDLAHVRAPAAALGQLQRQASAWRGHQDCSREALPDWANELGWRMARLYEQRFAVQPAADRQRRSTAQRLNDEIQRLLPVEGVVGSVEKAQDKIEQVRRIALPSILESLCEGFGRGQRERDGSALTDGLPKEALAQRKVMLSTQHRMHPEIADFSHQHVYECEALFSPVDMAAKRAWSFQRHDHRSIWLDVKGRFNGQANVNRDEAVAVIDELRQFERWAAQHPREDGQPWEVAVLTFYRGQEREMRNHLRRWSQQQHAMRHFHRGDRQRPYLAIELCTVDRFQGHEADLVILSIASRHATSFLESPNRLNVALTRARYQRIIVGDRHAMLRAENSLLGQLAKDEPWEKYISERDAS